MKEKFTGQNAMVYLIGIFLVLFGIVFYFDNAMAHYKFHTEPVISLSLAKMVGGALLIAFVSFADPSGHLRSQLEDLIPLLRTMPQLPAAPAAPLSISTTVNNSPKGESQ